MNSYACQQFFKEFWRIGVMFSLSKDNILDVTTIYPLSEEHRTMISELTPDIKEWLKKHPPTSSTLSNRK